MKSSLAIELSKSFEFGEGGEYEPPTHFTWEGHRYSLTNEVVDLLREEYEKVEAIKLGLQIES